jgi:hypothetical protein
MGFAFTGVILLVAGMFLISVAELLYDYLDRVDQSRIIDNTLNSLGYGFVFGGIIILFTLIIADLIVYNGKLP